MAIGYEAQEWKDGAEGGTPIDAAALNRIESGIAQTALVTDELAEKRLQTYMVAKDGETATQDIYGDAIAGPCLVLDLAERATWYVPATGDRTLITSGSQIDSLRDSLSRIKPVEFKKVDVDFGTFTDSKSVTAPAQDGYTFLCWLGAVSDSLVKSVYIEWPTVTSTKVWVVGGGSVKVWGFALYVSS